MKVTWRANNPHLLAWQIVNSPWRSPRAGWLRSLAASVVTTDSTAVCVTAVKPASRGGGIIVRLYAPAPPASPVMVRAPHLQVTKAFLCDARERDLEPLALQTGAVRVTMPGAIATIRLLSG